MEPRRSLRHRQVVNSPTTADLPTTKRKHEKPSNVKSPRKRRSKSNGKKTAETSEEGTGFANQGSWSSGWSLSDDEDLPPAVFSSPAKDNQVKDYKKHDIVWIKFRKEPYRPCLITSVHKNHVNFKFISGIRNHTYRAGLKKIIGFEDPDKNTELLNAGKKKRPHIVDAFERARLYFCRLSSNEDLSPLKYLFCDKTEDLLYGIVPEHDSKEENDEENEDDLFDGPVFDCSDIEEDEVDDKDKKDESNENGKDEDNCKITDQPKEGNGIEFEDIYQKMTVEEKANLLENLKIILNIIDSDECFLHLQQIVESAQSTRMVLLKEERNLDLQMRSGSLGPFLGAESTETDQLMDIVEKHTERLKYQGDAAFLSLNVLIPEAVIYAVHKGWQYTPVEAENFFMECTNQIPEWRERRLPCQSA